ncbi:hypothetical protein EZV62_004478 [Acer yangbiense]|uniref:Uncharacterized protein n=1 Tax=Acer yangbiense TaxID=1000413 RepID=A0A5C7IJT7_9ROSI|nr:hypothetical protein EZV62_004478 [Acer yangbiense]
MAEAAVTVAAEIAAEHVVDSISTQLGYIWNYKTNFENLEGQHRKLKDTLAQVQHSVEEAERKGEEIEQKVLSWLDRVGTINKEATKHYQHSKKAAFKAKEVSEVEKERNSLGEISYCTPPKEPWDQFLKDYKDFESRRSIVENVLKELSNSDVNMVGICGMGGAGKTTLAMVVGKRAEEDKLFDVVVFVEVTEKPDVRNIQGTIAGKLGLELHEGPETSVRANKLYEQLQKGRKNILLILDNIWEGCLEYLKKVGIPLGGDHRACKLLLTARGIDVLKTEMDCQTYLPVGDLNENDAWALFKKMAGACIELYGLQSIASEVAKRCGGLPVAIVTVAKALKGKQENAWSNALLELERPSLGNLGSVTSKTYKCIRLSYNQLNSNELKSIFLLCCTLVFTSNESVEGLLRYGMGLNLLNTVCAMGEARNRVNKLIQDLKNSFLLLETFDDEGFSIHDVVRDAGRAIAINDHNKYTVNDDRILQQDLAEENTLKNCTSITFHDISELPEELDCPQLKFLYVKPKIPFSKIPDNFFKGMPNLGVVHLIEMVLSPMPASFHLLKKLQTLNLDCCRLGDIAEIGNLKNLKILVLSSDIERLPEQLGELTRLKVLDLSKCSDIEVIPPKMREAIIVMVMLTKPWNGYMRKSDELRLSASDIRMILQKFQEHKFSKVQTLEVFDDESTVFPLDILQRFQNLNCLQLRDTSYKEIFSCEEVEKHAESLAQIKRLRLKKLDDLEQMWKQDSRSDLILHNLESLKVVECNNLITLVPTSASFQNMGYMKISGCNGLRSLVTATVAKSLVQLVRMRIKNCNEMSEIVAIDGDVKEDEIIFNNLEELELTNLSNLTTFYSGNYTLNFPSLNELQVTRCPKMSQDEVFLFRNLKHTNVTANVETRLQIGPNSP